MKVLNWGWVVGMVLLLLPTPFLYSQSLEFSQGEKDSLLNALNNERLTDSIRWELLTALADNENNPDSTEKYAAQAYQLAKNRGYENLTLKSITSLIYELNLTGKFEPAIRLTQEGLRLAKKLESVDKEMELLGEMGTLYYSLGNYRQALSYTLQAKTLSEQLGEFERLCQITNNIGEYYNELGIYDSAYLYYRESYRHCQSSDQFVTSAYPLGNIGTVFAKQGQRDSARYYIEEAIKILEAAENWYPITVYLTYMADLYAAQGQLVEAKRYLQESLARARKENLLAQIRDAHLQLSAFFEKHDQKDSALYHYQRHIAFRDSLEKEEDYQRLAEARADYEISLREVENQALERDKRNLTYLSVAIGLGLVGFVFFAISLQRSRNATKLANYDLRQQKALVDAKNEVITNKNEEITSSITYASRIQRAMLPSQELLQTHFPEHVLVYRPRDIVSGDFYWLQEAEGKVMITAADCTGHGVPGALMSMLGISILDDAVQERGLTAPNEILDYLNREVYRRLQQETTTVSDGMDLALCTWDPATRTLTYSGAKNPLVVRLPDGEERYLKADRLFIGGKASLRGGNFSAHTLELPPGSMVYMYSDGFQDQFGGDPVSPKKFMSSKFRALLFEIADRPVAEQQKHLERTFDQWMGEVGQIDDVLVLGFRV